MKSLTSNFVSKNEKELFYKIIILSTIAIGVCSNAGNKSTKLRSMKVSTVYNLYDVNNDQFGNFDQVHIPNKSPVIAKMISVLKPSFSSSRSNDMAEKIHQAFLKYKIEPQIVVAIIDAESDFNHSYVSSTGDLSLAQVNVEVWNKEFSRMNLDLIQEEKLKENQAYSLEVMAKILHILKMRYEKKDRRWYARYHSKTKKHKKEYLSKLDVRMKLLQKSKVAAL